MMNKGKCRHLLGSLSEYIDDTLEEELCAEIERHIADCDNCRIVVDSLNKTVYLYQTTADQVSAPDGVRQRLFRRLDLDKYLV